MIGEGADIEAMTKMLVESGHLERVGCLMIEKEEAESSLSRKEGEAGLAKFTFKTL